MLATMRPELENCGTTDESNKVQQNGSDQLDSVLFREQYFKSSNSIQ